MVLHDQENHQRCADADGESQNIDQGKDSVAAEVPLRDEQVVFEHGRVFSPSHAPRDMPFGDDIVNQLFIKVLLEYTVRDRRVLCGCDTLFLA